MTSSNEAAIPPRFYALSALAVVVAVGVTWAVARSTAPRPTAPTATTQSRRVLPPAPAPAVPEHDANVALVDATLPPPETDGGGLALPLPTRAELALVAPLTEGSALGDAQVVIISRVERGVVRVVSRRGAETIDLAIALAGAGDRPAAAKVGRYAVYHYNTSAPSLAASGLAMELAAILRRNVNVPPPPGMTEAPR